MQVPTVRARPKFTPKQGDSRAGALLRDPTVCLSHQLFQLKIHEGPAGCQTLFRSERQSSHQTAQAQTFMEIKLECGEPGGTELPSHYSNSQFNHLRKCQLFSEAAARLCIPPTKYLGSDFSASSPVFVIIQLFLL